MTRAALLLCLALATSASAQTAEEEGDGFSLMERGVEMFMRGLFGELDPLLRDLQELAEGVEPALRDFVTEMGPALRGILEQVDDWSAYHPPEMLENGDIILRRKEPLPPEMPEPEPDAEGEIEI